MRIRPLATLLLVMIVAMSASAAAAEDAATTPDTSQGSVLRVAVHGTEKNLNPFVEPQAQPLTHDLTMLVYDTLFWSQSRLDPEEWLATGAEPSEDFRTWTITLRDDVRWHDGEQFSADDVAFTFEYFSADGGPGRYGHHVYQHPVFESATVIDETTVELSFAGPIPSFKLLPGADLPILPQHIWAGVADPRADVTSLPIGTGPYRMVDYQPDISYQLEANQEYFLGAPLIDTLAISVIPDDEAAFASLEAGQIDFVARNVPVSLNDQLERNDDLDIIGGTRNQSVYLAFNGAKPVLQDKRVRQGLSLALDVHDMLDIVEGGAGRLGTDTWTHPNSPYTRDPTGVHLSDQLAAQQLLDAAGLTPGADGGRVGPDGQPLALTLGVPAGSPTQLGAAEMVAEQLGLVGVAVTIQPLDQQTFIQARIGDTASAPDLDMLIGELEAHSHDDPDHLFFLFHSASGGFGSTFARYTNPEFDAIVEDALDEPAESSTRLDLVHQAQDILAEDLPAIVLYYPAGRLAYRPDAYDGWASDAGHGVFTKRSFLDGYADIGEDLHAGSRPEVEPFQLEQEDGGVSPVAIGGIAVAVIAGSAAGVLAIRDRRRTDDASPS
jgi:peptide/nickel transport system substrate-binding protein